MNFASKTAPLRLDPAIERRSHPAQGRVPNHVFGHRSLLPGVGFEPAAIEVLGDHSELHDKIGGQVFGRDLASLLPP